MINRSRISGWLRQNTKRFLMIDAILLIVASIFVFGPARPEEVEGLTATGSTYETVDLKWNKTENARSYHIFRSEDGKKYDFLTSTSGTRYRDDSLITGKTYYYSVVASNILKNTSVKTAEKAEAVPILESPELEIDTSDGKIKLNYSDTDGAIGYEIIRDGKEIASEKGTTYIDDTASVDEEHKYEVRAYRYIKDPVYSEPSKSKDAVLHTVGKIDVEVEDSDLVIKWDGNEKYSKYKIYSNEEKLSETSETSYVVSDFKKDKKYDLKIVGYNEDESVQSPDSVKSIKVIEEEMTNKDAINAAVEWGIKIAEDDTFTYGAGRRAHNYGCYFCQTNVGPKMNKKGKSLVNGHSYEKTYCCNPFVHACFAHGANDQAMLKACQNGSGIAMKPESFTRYGNWKNCGKLSTKELKKGDVLVRTKHVMLYIGDGKIVHAAREGWGPEGIRVSDVSSNYNFVMRYTGKGSGTKLVVHEVDSDGNILDEKEVEEQE